jgi:hypothetical protein
MLHEDERGLVDRERQQIALVRGREERRALGGGQARGRSEFDGAILRITAASPAGRRDDPGQPGSTRWLRPSSF